MRGKTKIVNLPCTRKSMREVISVTICDGCWQIQRMSSTGFPFFIFNLYFQGSYYGPGQAPLSMDSPGQNTGGGSRSLLQGIFTTQGSTHVSHIAGGFFTVWATREARYSRYSYRKTVIGKKRASHGDCLCVKEEGNRPSWLHLEKEGNSILHFQWLLIMCLVATGITYLQPNWPPGLINTRFHTKISHRQERSNPQCSQSPLYLYSNHWCRLQSITSWPFWLWIMAVTWLYLPLTLSRLGLRNLGMWAWAIHLRYIRFSQKSVGVLG